MLRADSSTGLCSGAGRVGDHHALDHDHEPAGQRRGRGRGDGRPAQAGVHGDERDGDQPPDRYEQNTLVVRPCMAMLS